MSCYSRSGIQIPLAVWPDNSCQKPGALSISDRLEGKDLSLNLEASNGREGGSKDMTFGGRWDLILIPFQDSYRWCLKMTFRCLRHQNDWPSKLRNYFASCLEASRATLWFAIHLNLYIQFLFFRSFQSHLWQNYRARRPLWAAPSPWTSRASGWEAKMQAMHKAVGLGVFTWKFWKVETLGHVRCMEHQ